MAGKRDYAAEYARRIERARERAASEGVVFNRSAARGHPRYGESYVTPGRTKPRPPAGTMPTGRLGRAASLMGEGRSLTAAAREAGVAPERLRAYLRQNPTLYTARGGPVEAMKVGGRWVPAYTMPMPSGGAVFDAVFVGPEQATLLGEYWNAVRAWREDGDTTHLAPFQGKTVTDVKGRKRVLETNPNVLRRLEARGDLDIGEDLYRTAGGVSDAA